MYYPYFITYMGIGLAISLAVFYWALNNGQFKDQQRARFLPLADETAPIRIRASRLGRYEIYALFVLAVAGLALSAGVLIFALTRG